VTSRAAELDGVADLCTRLNLTLRQAEIADDLLSPVADALGAETASFRLLAARTPKPDVLSSVGIADSVHAAYRDRYFELDPARRLLTRPLAAPVFGRARRIGEAAKDGDTPQMQARLRAGFARYRREFLFPNGFFHHVGFCILSADRRAWVFDFHRGPRSRNFTAVERAKARLIAVFLHAKIAASWHDAAALSAATPSGAPLSTREIEVADAVALGLSNKQVAASLGISVRTVENHLRSVFAKLGVATRTRLVVALRASAAGKGRLLASS
jgi:DNA-binding CsgD family transcriptional regulator